MTLQNNLASQGFELDSLCLVNIDVIPTFTTEPLPYQHAFNGSLNGELAALFMLSSTTPVNHSSRPNQLPGTPHQWMHVPIH